MPLILLSINREMIDCGPTSILTSYFQREGVSDQVDGGGKRVVFVAMNYHSDTFGTDGRDEGGLSLVDYFLRCQHHIIQILCTDRPRIMPCQNRIELPLRFCDEVLQDGLIFVHIEATRQLEPKAAFSGLRAHGIAGKEQPLFRADENHAARRVSGKIAGRKSDSAWIENVA